VSKGGKGERALESRRKKKVVGGKKTEKRLKLCMKKVSDSIERVPRGRYGNSFMAQKNSFNATITFKGGEGSGEGISFVEKRRIYRRNKGRESRGCLKGLTYLLREGRKVVNQKK